MSPASWTLWASRLRRRGEHGSDENDDDNNEDDEDDNGDDNDDDQVQPGGLGSTVEMCLAHLSSTASGDNLIINIMMIKMMIKMVMANVLK